MAGNGTCYIMHCTQLYETERKLTTSSIQFTITSALKNYVWFLTL